MVQNIQTCSMQEILNLLLWGEYTYALVASYSEGVQIINVTEPDSISAVLGISDGTGNFSTLNGAYDIKITTIDSSTYALVAAAEDDGVQIIDITYVYSTAEPSTLVSKVAFVIVVILPEYFGSPSVATASGI